MVMDSRLTFGGATFSSPPHRQRPHIVLVRFKSDEQILWFNFIPSARFIECRTLLKAVDMCNYTLIKFARHFLDFVPWNMKDEGSRHSSHQRSCFLLHGFHVLFFMGSVKTWKAEKRKNSKNRKAENLNFRIFKFISAAPLFNKKIMCDQNMLSLAHFLKQR